MKKQILFLPLLLSLLCQLAQAQTVAPVVPERITFADISVQLDPDARRIVQQDVNALLANRQYWTAKLDRVVLYFPMIETILIEEDVPTDFKYLAVQESSLTPDAVSSSTAVGYWQFKRETATDNGMRVDDEVDERKSITASTRGAAKYLKRSNSQFNNWVASLYSYYLGAGGIAKLIPPEWYYAKEVALDGHTDRYILRFFAHKIAIDNALQTHQTSNRFALIEYPNGGGKTMKSIANELGVDEFELRKYNRWVLGESVPTDKAYVLAIPVPTNQINDVRQKIVNVSGRKTPDFVQNDVGFPVLRRVTTGLSSKNEPVLYEINGLPGIQAQAGDNAASLSRKAKISLSSFLRYNDMSERDPVITNDVYYLAKKRKKALVPFHTVREDETARSISQRYGIRLKKLLRYNRLDRVQKLVTGRVMWLRERRPSDKPVEIINAPTPPVYDQTPTPAAGTRPVAVIGAPLPMNGSRTVSGSENVPRNASERKMYQPKLVDGGVTPNDGTSAPAAPQRTESPRPVVTTSQPTNSRSMPAAPSSTNSSAGSQRVVIVRTPDATQPTKTVPVATTPEPAPATTKSTETYAATPRPKSKPAAEIDMGRPESGRPESGRPERGRSEPSRSETGAYDGPREQQADGTITKIGTTPASQPNNRPATLPNSKAESNAERSEPRSSLSSVSASVPKSVSSATTASRSTSAATTVNHQTTSSTTPTTHVVEHGQTFYSIAKMYGLTVDELRSINNLTGTDKLEAGQKLTVKLTPGSRVVHPSASALAKQASNSDSSADITYHTVAKGETMFRISQLYGVTVDQIQTWNNLTDTGVKMGQKLKIVKN